MKEFRAIVYGRVQMVMYRDFAERSARRLGIVGTVRNLQDGTVEVVAQGNDKALREYIEMLRRGSLLSKVERVDIDWRESTKTFQNFSIAY